MKKILFLGLAIVLIAFRIKADPEVGVANKSNAVTPQYAGYLFAYFEGSGPRPEREHLRFGISPNAVEWEALNGNDPVIHSDSISVSGGIRDPHILRSEDGKAFYVVATDMSTAKKGWKSNPGVVLLKSTDLIHWTHSAIHLSDTYPEKFGDAYWVWAPQTIYDPSVEKYMVYFTLKRNDSSDLVTYYAYANENFTAFEDEPRFLFNAKYGSIDNDIIYKDGIWHLFYKGNTKDIQGVEVKNGIQKATSKNLHTGWEEDFIYLDAYVDTRTSVEGSSIFKLNDSDTYVLMYDLYSSQRYEFQISNDLYNFTSIPQSFIKDFTPRHGSVISITQEEMDRLNREWGNNSEIGL